MPRTRIKIVTGLGPARSPQRIFIGASLSVHVLLSIALVWIPQLKNGPRIPINATVVELVGALPGGAPERPAPAAPPPVREQTPAKPPDEGVKLQSKKIEPVPEKKPEKKPEPERPSETPVTPAAPPAPVVPVEETSDGEAAGPGTAGSAAAGASVSALEVGDVAFGWYRASVTNALYGRWRRPVLSDFREPLEVRVAFEIMRDGTVRGVRIEDPSGVPSLDRSALRAVTEAAPLPPLPATLAEPYLPASFVFRLFPDGY